MVRKVSTRFVAENDSWILIAPYYSIVPYETWILPKGHMSNLEELGEEQFEDLAAILRDALTLTKMLLGDLAYNLMMYQLPSDYHFNLRIQPALTKIAGFEKIPESTLIQCRRSKPQKSFVMHKTTVILQMSNLILNLFQTFILP